MNSGQGTFVVSLDLELHGGVRDWCNPGDGYISNLTGERAAVARLLEAFVEKGIAATWVTVGFLFARTSEELREFSPKVLPTYVEAELNPYGQVTGSDEIVDPLHFGSELVDQIGSAPGQIATHTYSHYYCLEPGQTVEAFRADIASACTIAAARGLEIKSTVFPRNQVNRSYLPALLEHGIAAYKGKPARVGIPPGGGLGGVEPPPRGAAARLLRQRKRRRNDSMA